MKRKSLRVIIPLCILLAGILLFGIFGFENPASSDTVESIARRASVQPIFYIPVLKAYFATPLEEEKKLTKEDIERIVAEKIEAAIAEDRREREKSRYEESLTDIEVWGFASPSKTEIPLGALSPEWAKFPERVLVAYKVEKKEITAWEKEYENDVLAISELANVSPSQARGIIGRLKAEGYRISKEEIEEAAEVKLLWFDDGWNDKWPMELDWKVTLVGEEDNLITGYDSRGILTIKPIPDKNGNLAKVYVKAGYFDLVDEFKPKSSEVLGLEGKIKSLETDLEEKRKALEEKEEKEKEKRDISKATWLDVASGRVIVKVFWWRAEASGTFLGNMRVRKEFSGWSYWYPKVQFIEDEKKGIILTNAHVAVLGLEFDLYVTEDKEIMWIFYPGYPFIRYTQDSDLFGSPAHILAIDGEPVLSHDYDTAIMVTTEVSGYEGHRAFLGDSDNVNEGDKVIMVGNPMYMQKFLSRGVVSNKSYDMMKSSMPWEWGFSRYLDQRMYNWLMHSNFWFDTPIGIGGTSGSGVWATNGPEKNKIIALHNMGMYMPAVVASAESEGKEIDAQKLSFDENLLLCEMKDKYKAFFENFPFKEAKFRFTAKNFIKKDPSFEEALEARGCWVHVPGMNAGVPINYVKRFLQERGLNPEDFGWEALPDQYWEK